MRSTKAGLPRHMRALVTLTVVGCVMFGLMAAQAGATTGRAPAGKSAVPGVALSAPVSGREAIDSLDTALPSVAEAHGISATELSERLLWDRALTVDRDGRLFYLDPAPEAGDPAVADAAAGAFSFANTPASLADTFLLHSLPGANRVIYLDFDGHVLSGCAWNSYNSGADIVCPPFDIDGAPETFSNEERVRIQEIWQRVAEDYAPFAVDVTTAFPGEDRITRSSSADRVYGMRVLISPLSQYMGNYGGIAYVNVFDFVGDYYKPALVFPENLGPNGSKYVAEAASHENGHTLGLYHDGTTSGVEYYSGHGSGDTGWAPIMGSGYYKNLTQWSKGEYSLANNKEDDLAILSTSSHIPYRADDHGGSISAASALAGSGQLSASGVIGRTRDVDFFSVSSGAGTLSVSAAPLAVGSNLDIKLELRNSRGAVVASSNPTDLLTASLSKTVAGGTFYVAVSGTGRGNPLTGYSNYGSLGAYSLALNVPASGSNQAPTAAMTATPTSGTAPLTVSFDGTASVDPDGSIVSYAWAFGDGTSATGSSANHTYTAAGTYTATLTVTDNADATDTESVTVTVVATGSNQAPTAAMTATPTSGTAPLTVSFDGTASVDPDGSIVSYAWAFGDGTSATGSSANHTYTAAGTYTATLTVTDNADATGSAQTTISVQTSTAKTMFVASKTVSVVRAFSGYQARAVVKIVDGQGRPVSRATVKGVFSGAVSGAARGTTGVTGLCTLRSSRFAANGAVDFDVTSVTKTGWVYGGVLPSDSSASLPPLTGVLSTLWSQS